MPILNLRHKDFLKAGDDTALPGLQVRTCIKPSIQFRQGMHHSRPFASNIQAQFSSLDNGILLHNQLSTTDFADAIDYKPYWCGLWRLGVKRSTLLNILNILHWLMEETENGRWTTQLNPPRIPMAVSQMISFAKYSSM